VSIYQAEEVSLMEQTRQTSGSATRWGPLFGLHARDWAETWEGPGGWGTPVYEHVLDRTRIGSGTRVLDCGCGAGRFTRMAADRGAIVAGIDAAEKLIEIASERTPDGDFRLGDLETLPWPDDSFDVVTGFSAFQFADDKALALTEARRVSRGPVAVVIPTRVAESGIAAVFKPLFPLFPPEALESMKQSGMFALSEPGKLDDLLTAARLQATEADDEIECPVGFDDADTAARAFVGAGPMALAIRHSGEQAIAEAVRDALTPFTGTDGRLTLPAWYRVVVAQADNTAR
jgi:SAM-dependent methyltransferase